MRGVVNALLFATAAYLLTAWVFGIHHDLCDPVNALPWVRCGFSP